MLRMPPRPAVTGAREIGLFFRDVACGGDIARIRLSATSANGRPAVAMQRRTDDGALIPHGVMTFEIENEMIVGLDAFIEAALVSLFSVVASWSPSWTPSAGRPEGDWRPDSA